MFKIQNYNNRIVNTKIKNKSWKNWSN